MITRTQRAWRWVEMLALLVAPAWVYYAGWWRPELLVALVVLGLIGLLILLRDPTFDRRQLWNFSALKYEYKSMLLLYAMAVVVSVVGVYFFVPEQLFTLVRNRPSLWLMIMVGYPLLSVYAQEVLYRVLFYHRYAVLFGGRWNALIANAVVFAMAHVLFAHWLPIVATFVGGLIFGWRYERRRSLAVAWVEHTIYGQLIFTVGLGIYFFHGTTHAMQAISGQ